jgi:hypothetical protein
MPSSLNQRSNWRSDLTFLLPCLTAAVLVRSFFFGSITLGDDVNYWMQTIATGLDNTWPPEKTHWHTRIGFILPCVLLVKILGLKVWVPYLFTLLGGLLEIALVFFVGRHFATEKTAKLATWLAVFFPLNILYSGCLFLDVWNGLLGALSIWFWYRALQTEQPRDYALTSLFFGLAWLCRETVIMAAPIYLALWWQAGRWRRPKMLWAIPPGLLILLSEIALYQITAHNWHYRFDSIFDSKAQALEDVANDPGFLFTPVVQLFTSHEFGLFFAAGLGIAILFFRKMPRALVLWLLVGFVWFSWGTMTPAGWIPMQRDPRYLSLLTIPCLVLLAIWIASLRSRFWRIGIVATLLVSGLLCAFLDVGRVKLSAHRRFATSEYNASNTTAEPFVYFGIRAAQNFSGNSINISCATDLGRISAVKLMPHLPNARLLSVTEARYAVFSSQTQPEKWKSKIKEGWRKVSEIRGETVLARDLVLRAIGKIRGPKTNLPPGLIVLENPAFALANP